MCQMVEEQFEIKTVVHGCDLFNNSTQFKFLVLV